MSHLTNDVNRPASSASSYGQQSENKSSTSGAFVSGRYMTVDAPPGGKSSSLVEAPVPVGAYGSLGYGNLASSLNGRVVRAPGSNDEALSYLSRQCTVPSAGLLGWGAPPIDEVPVPCDEDFARFLKMDREGAPPGWIDWSGSRASGPRYNLDVVNGVERGTAKNAAECRIVFGQAISQLMSTEISERYLNGKNEHIVYKAHEYLSNRLSFLMQKLTPAPAPGSAVFDLSALEVISGGGNCIGYKIPYSDKLACTYRHLARCLRIDRVNNLIKVGAILQRMDFIDWSAAFCNKNRGRFIPVSDDFIDFIRRNAVALGDKFDMENAAKDGYNSIVDSLSQLLDTAAVEYAKHITNHKTPRGVAEGTALPVEFGPEDNASDRSIERAYEIIALHSRTSVPEDKDLPVAQDLAGELEDEPQKKSSRCAIA